MDAQEATTLLERSLLQAVVLGGNVLGTHQGAKKTRRRVPRKQELLIRCVTNSGRASFTNLTGSFPGEWSAIQERNEGEYQLVAKREFFRNMADLAGRVNEALAAGYIDDQARPKLKDLTSGCFIGLAFDHQRMEIWLHETQEIDDYLRGLAISAEGQHVAFTLRARKQNAAPQPKPAAPSPPTPVEPPPKLGRPDPGQDPAGTGAPLSNGQGAGVQAAAEPASPPPLLSSTHELAPPTGVPAVLDQFEEDTITGVWRFRLDGHDIELEAKHGYVKIDGAFRQCRELRTLKQPEELHGPSLRALRLLIHRVEEDGSKA